MVNKSWWKIKEKKMCFKVKSEMILSSGMFFFYCWTIIKCCNLSNREKSLHHVRSCKSKNDLIKKKMENKTDKKKIIVCFSINRERFNWNLQDGKKNKNEMMCGFIFPFQKYFILCTLYNEGNALCPHSATEDRKENMNFKWN